MDPLLKVPTNPLIPVWRYMDLARFASLLSTKTLFFCRADRFEDKFEGSMPAASVQEFAEFYAANVKPGEGLSREELLAKVSKTRADMRKWVYVNCWHLNELESVAMWDLYARRESGLAIKADFSRLKAALAGRAKLNEVTYIDFSKDKIASDNLIRPFLVKRASFQHERELRATVVEFPMGKDGVEFERENPVAGTEIPVDLDVLIERIFVSPWAPAWFEAVVRDIVGKYGLNKPVERSSLADSPLF